MFVAGGVRGGQRRPAGLGRVQGPQVVLRGRRGRAELLPQPPAAGPRLLDPVRHGAGARTRPSPTRSTSSGTASAPTRAAGARSRASTGAVHDRAPAHARLHRRASRPTKQDVGDRPVHRHVQDPRHRPRRRRPPRSGAAIVATFRRDGFLNFVYFTDYENRDPQALDRRHRARHAQQTNCADKYRTARAGKGCTEIQFVTGDEINGPLHTNDESLLICGTPIVRAQKIKTARGQDRRDRGLRRRARLRRRNGGLQRRRRRSTRRRQVHDERQAVPMPTSATSSSQTSPTTAARSTRARRSSASSGSVDGRHQLRRHRRRDDHDRRAWPRTACSTSRTTAPARASIPTDGRLRRVGDLRQRLRQRHLHASR